MKNPTSYFYLKECVTFFSRWNRNSCSFVLLLTFLFLFNGVLALHAQNVTISLDVKNKSITEVLSIIEKKNNLFFTYDYNLFNPKRKISVSLKNKKIEEILKVVFKGENIGYKIKGKNVVLYKIDSKVSKGQQRSAKRISGIIRDLSGVPIIGASIAVENGAGGTISDLNGKFSLNAHENDLLTISYIGFGKKELRVKKDYYEITLEEDANLVDEVVVVGYGTQKRGNLTGSIASLKTKEINTTVSSSLAQSLQGKMPGLQIRQQNGEPGTFNSMINIRGYGEPLYVIDGIVRDGSVEFQQLNPSDIESVSVLKDASAAVYGMNASNGVIVVTTKRGESHRPQFTYSGNVGWQKVTDRPLMANAAQYLEMYDDAIFYRDGVHSITNEELNKWRAGGPGYESTDWYNETMKKASLRHNHNLSLMGGNSKTNYIANLNYASRQGIMKKSDFESFQGRIEVTHRMFDDKLKLKFGLFGKKNQMESTTSGGSFRGWVYGQATRRNPTDPVRNEDGTWNENVSKFEYENPLALLYEAEGNVKKTQLRYNGNIVYNPIKDLTLSAVFSYIRDNMNRGYGETLNHISALRDGLAGWSSVGAYTKMEKLMELTAQYNKEIGAHKFSVLGGYSYNETDFEELWIDNYGFQDDYFGGWHNIGIGSALKDGKANIGSKKTPTNLIGFFGRATYSFKNRYLLMGALRYEGASQLWGTDNAWGLFPSISVGWRITEEAFMKNQKIFDDLKLRVGYGVTGSQPKDPFLGVAMLKYGSYAFVNGNWVQTIVPASNPNPDLKWEEKKETNIGLDFVSWGGRLSGSIDYYNRDVDGLIYEYGVPTPPNLYNKTMANGGTMRNRGVEVLVTVVPVQNKDFEWSTTGTFSLNSNKLISLSGSIFKSDYDYFNTGTVEYSGQVADSHRVQVGESIGNFYGFKVVDVDSEGRWIYEDRNGELVNYKDFTHAPEDKHVIGNGLPKWYAGWNNTLRYKNFDLNVTMRGAFGFQIINGGRMNYENVKNSRFENRLKSVNDLVFGKHTLSPEVEPEFNSYYVEDGDYWKIDNITLGYSFGQVGKYIKSLRIYGSVLNALTITGYKGIDPEVSTDGLTPGYDTRDRYPSVRSFTFGVNVKF